MSEFVRICPKNHQQCIRTAGAAQTLGAGYETLSNIDFDVFQANTEKCIDAVWYVYVVGARYLLLVIFGQIRTNSDMSELGETSMLRKNR